MQQPSRRLSVLIALLAGALSLAGLTLVTTSGPAAGADDGYWRASSAKPSATKGGHDARVRPTEYAAFTLRRAGLEAALSAAPEERSSAAPVTVRVPAPDGSLVAFAVRRSPIMEAGLAAAHPEIETYAGRGVDDPSATIRLDLTPMGFHASVRSGAAPAWYVDPAWNGDDSLYLSYEGRAVPAPERGLIEPDADELGGSAVRGDGPSAGEAPGAPVSLRTYRLALVSDPSYATYFGTANVLAEKITLMNRVNQIYNDDLAIRMILVSGSDALNLDTAAKATGTNGPCGATACYTSAQLTSCGTGTLTRNTQVLGILIGAANYDIGHIVLGVNGGGVAYLNSVGGSNKGGGCTGLPTPRGDFFAIDYVAHEMGHQFGGPHTFNGVTANCSGGNRSAAASVEPGSGSSVMAYAGICGADDLQPHTDPYFSAQSIKNITAYVTSGTAAGGTVSASGNAAPAVTAPAAQTIPIRTPFALTGSGTDADGDTLVYTWEQTDRGGSTGTALGSNTKADGPLFRMFSTYADVTDAGALQIPSPGENAATTSPTRSFPDLAQVLANNTNADTGSCPTLNTASIPTIDCFSEFLPNASYVGAAVAGNTEPSLNFRLTARDGAPEGGGTAYADVKLTLDKTAGPFRVTAPSGGSYAGGSSQTVTWEVNNTQALAAQVRISMSADGGATWPYELAASTPNDGSQAVTLPNIDATGVRLRIEAVGNYFYDVNDAGFAITATTTTTSTPTDTTATSNPTPTTPGDTTLPETTIVSGPADLAFALDAAPTFGLVASEPGSFVCTLDGAVAPCSASGLSVSVAPGTHTVTAAAVDAAGNVDATPAAVTWSRPFDDTAFKAKAKQWKAKKSKAAYGGSLLRSKRPGARLTTKVQGATALALVVAKAPKAGKLAVYLGKKKIGTVKLKGPKAARLIVVVKRFATPVSGKLTIVAKGKKRSYVDGVGVLR